MKKYFFHTKIINPFNKFDFLNKGEGEFYYF